jgi:hypothetical protein
MRDRALSPLILTFPPMVFGIVVGVVFIHREGMVSAVE